MILKSLRKPFWIIEVIGMVMAIIIVVFAALFVVGIVGRAVGSETWKTWASQDDRQS